MRILILGDSFSADWSVKYKDYKGWPNLLADKYDVTNLAQAGAGEHKVYKQLMSVTDLSKFNFIFISHCSPWRLSTIRHPIHHNDPLHKNADLIFADIDYHVEKGVKSKELLSAHDFFKYHFDKEYHEDVLTLFKEKINSILKPYNFYIINLRHQAVSTQPNALNFQDLERGSINHLTEEGNKIVFDTIENIINKGNKTL
jgi:hypothetical protein